MEISQHTRLDCPHCDHNDALVGFTAIALPRKRRDQHVQVYRCPRCGKLFAPTQQAPSALQHNCRRNE